MAGSSDQRETMTWDQFGDASRELARRILADGFVPDYISPEVGDWNSRLAMAIRDDDRNALAEKRSVLLGQIAQAPVMAQANAPLLAMMGFGEDA